MKNQLYEPLCSRGSIELVAKHADPTNKEEMVDHHYRIQQSHVIIFEGIFLFQGRFTFDYSIWVECSFETALSRALMRNQKKRTYLSNRS